MKKTLVIGVDADGVLVDMSGFYLREGRKFYKKPPVDENAYHSAEMFGVSKKQEFLFGLRVFTKYCRSEPPYPDCARVIQQLNAEGHELHEITARKMTTQRNVLGAYYRSLFEKWLKKNGMSFSSIEYCSETYACRDKLLACRKLKADFMIEDKPDVALYLAENGVNVLLYDAPYNRTISHANMQRVHDWPEIYKVISMAELHAQASPNTPQERSLDDGSQTKGYGYRNRLPEQLIKENTRKFRLLYRLTFLPFAILYHAKIYGKENIPFQDGLILASNHLDSRDQYYISQALGNRVFCGFAASTIQNTFRGRLAAMTGGAIFIDRNDRQSKKTGEMHMIQYLVSGISALIFPEGTRKNKDAAGRAEKQLPFKLGAVSIAQKTGTGILPISIFHSNLGTILRFGEIQYVRDGDDLLAANAKLEQTILQLTEMSERECL